MNNFAMYQKTSFIGLSVILCFICAFPVRGGEGTKSVTAY